MELIQFAARVHYTVRAAVGLALDVPKDSKVRGVTHSLIAGVCVGVSASLGPLSLPGPTKSSGSDTDTEAMGIFIPKKESDWEPEETLGWSEQGPSIDTRARAGFEAEEGSDWEAEGTLA